MICGFIQPRNSLCDINMPEIEVPFRIGIRAYNLRDPSVGSLVMIGNINYMADICLEPSLKNFFFFFFF